jgi:4-hydroxybenzoate polyprenyltransferase
VSKITALLKASHFGPTVLVTTIAFFFAEYYWWEGPAYLIAFGVFLGQLIVGWSNDLYDYQDDLSHQRIKKPLVAKGISYEELRKWTFWMIPSAFFANLFGPLGIKGGLVYMLGIACGVGYNFYFKFTALSPLPYAVAFAALPSCIAISKEITPPLWMWLGGAIFGVAAHFINVLKDMKKDQQSGIRGLPQRLGSVGSIIAAVVLITAGVPLLLYSR